MEFEGSTKDFLQWFTAQPNTTFHSSLQIVDLRAQNAGRGIIATADIPAETELFSIPRSLIISLETSELAQKLPELFSDENKELASDDDFTTDVPVQWLNLILVLLYETLHYQTSQWQPYFSVLPTRHAEFDTLMFWTPDQLTELQASEIRNKIGRESANRMFRERIIPVVNKHHEIFYPGTIPHLSDDELLERCHTIGSLIMSYAFDLAADENEDEDEDGEDGWVEDHSKPAQMGMVPMADMLNADAEFNAHLSHGENVLTMTSLRDIKAGEEILNYYGPLPNAELLRRYGYTSSKHSRYDVVEIIWPLLKSVLLQAKNWDESVNEEKLKAVISRIEENEGLDENDGFMLERESGDPNEQGFCSTEAKFEKLPDELVAVVNAVVKKVYKDDTQKRKITDGAGEVMLKRQAGVLFEKLINTRIGQYPTSIEEDVTLLSRLGSSDRRQCMATKVRVGEKRLLHESLSWIKETQMKLESTTAAQNGSGINHKKQKR